MASSTNGCGCGVLLMLFGFGLLLAYWPLILLAAFVVLGVIGLGGLAGTWGNSQQRQQLQALAEAAQSRFGGEICRLGERHALVESISLEPLRGTVPVGPPRLQLQLQILETIELENGGSDGRDGSLQLEVRQEKRVLPIPTAEMGRLASMGAFGRHLESQGIVIMNDLSVEAKAARAAFQCARERDWAHASQQKLRELIASTRVTLAKASGNELLEPSIPQLQQALETFQEEQQKLQRHLKQSNTMLRKLHDFLSVPESIRPILSFDLDGLFDPSRLQELEASFEEVVQLNDAYRSLSRDKII